MSEAIFREGIDCSPENVRQWIAEAERQKARAEAAEADRDELLETLILTSDYCDHWFSWLERERRKVARVEALRQEYKRDDEWSLNTFGQHHPVAGIAYDHLTAALADEADDSNDESSAQTTGHAGSQEDDR